MKNLLKEVLYINKIIFNNLKKKNMNLKDIFNGKKSKSFAEQLAAVKSIFKSSYEQAIQLNSEIAEDTKVK